MFVPMATPLIIKKLKKSFDGLKAAANLEIQMKRYK